MNAPKCHLCGTPCLGAGVEERLTSRASRQCHAITLTRSSSLKLMTEFAPVAHR
jgi:hypothetical protein